MMAFYENTSFDVIYLHRYLSNERTSQKKKSPIILARIFSQAASGKLQSSHAIQNFSGNIIGESEILA